MNSLPLITEMGLNPNLVDELSATVTYLGYAIQGDPTKCAIVKVIKTGTETQFLCPNGYFDFVYDWSHRDDNTYTYSLRKYLI